MDNFSYNKDIGFAMIMEAIIPNVKLNIFLLNPYLNNYDFINNFFCRSFIHKDKFEVYKEFNSNPFLNSQKKIELENYFYNAQKIYHIYKKFYNKKTFQKYKHHSGNIDLFHNSLDLCTLRYKISLICDDIIYNFNINDIIRLINSGLVYSPDFFPEPKLPSNPWTNIQFSKTNLYNIYFHIADNNILMSQLFYSFFRCNWNINKFLSRYEAVIRDKSISHYYDDISLISKYNDIIIMLRKYRSVIPNLNIHPRFSKTELVEKLEHLLPLHLTCEYTHNPTNRLLTKRDLKRALQKFNRENPRFGRIFLTPRRYVNRTILPVTQRVNHIEEGSELQNHQFYTSLNLLSVSIPNYTSVEDIFDHITESLQSSQNDSDEDNNAFESDNLYNEDSENSDTQTVNIYLEAIIHDFEYEDEDDDYDDIELLDED